jgi:hypothetical protein
LNAGSSHYLLHAGFLLGLFFNSEDGDDMFLQNVGLLSMDCMVCYIPDERTLHPNSWCLIYTSISQTFLATESFGLKTLSMKF